MSSTNKQNEIVIGIDLGTSYCCNSVYRNGHVEIIPNSIGNRTTPSYISFTDTEKLIGDSAKNNVSMNPYNTPFAIKRLIGRKFDDKSVQSDIKFFPFKVTKDAKTEKPLIHVNYMDEEKQYFPEQLSAMLLEQFKKDAEDYLGIPITKAVVTVPAYFNNEQRQATKDAGEIAGLEIIRIINEPTSAALAYGIGLCDSEKAQDKNVLVFDLGAGTLDVSILNITKGIHSVVSTCGDTHLGGEDFDNKLVIYCASEFAKLNKLSEQEVIGLLKDLRALRRLRSACENVKRALSTSLTMTVQVDSFFNSEDLNIKVTRAKFEEICHDIFHRCIPPLDNALRDAKLEKSEICEIIMIGGSTRIPYVREMVRNYFNGKALKLDVNPDEAVSMGAAIQGAILVGNSDKNISDMVLVDVTPLSLGIETSHGEMSKIIDRNTPIPCSFQQFYSTESDNQRNVKIKIFEGERALTKDNTMLGTFELTELPPMPRGILKISVNFEIDADGILQVSATEVSTGKSKNIIIKKDKTKLSRDDILKLINDAKMNADLDEKIKATFTAKNAFENYLYSVKRALSNFSNLTTTDANEMTEVQSYLSEAYKWYETNPMADADAYHSKHLEVEGVISPLIQKVYNNKSKQIKETHNDVKENTVGGAVEEKHDEEEKDVVEEPVHEERVEEENIVEEPVAVEHPDEENINDEEFNEDVVEVDDVIEEDNLEEFIEEKEIAEKPIDISDNDIVDTHEEEPVKKEIKKKIIVVTPVKEETTTKPIKKEVKKPAVKKTSAQKKIVKEEETDEGDADDEVEEDEEVVEVKKPAAKKTLKKVVKEEVKKPIAKKTVKKVAKEEEVKKPVVKKPTKKVVKEESEEEKPKKRGRKPKITTE